MVLPMAYIGTAGWNVPAQHRAAFPESGSHLERYAQRFSAVEVNTSFYRPHQHKTWIRWAAMTPDNFRFCVKFPKSITHEGRLKNCDERIDRFESEVSGLGEKLKALLIQLPPSLRFDKAVADKFFKRMQLFDVPLVLEPRHKSWFEDEATSLIQQLQICLAAVDPAPARESLVGIPSKAVAYFRLHGSPVIYHSDYPAQQLAAIAERMRALSIDSRSVWCIFDNTADGHAASNALSLVELLSSHVKSG